MPILEYDRQARPLGPGVLTIGSGPEAGWRVLDHELAPVHALVTLERDGRAQLARPRDDVRILVNGQAMAGPIHVIKVGDTITLGDATFHMRAGRRQDEATDRAFLRDMSRGRAWQIGERLEIGRDVACPVHLPDPDVSRVHAELVREGNDIIVRSRGGIVFLNSSRVTSDVPLAEGDELSIGRTILRFTRETPASAAVMPPTVGPRRPSVGDARMARAQTSYIGVVQAREQLARSRRKEWAKVARIALIAVGVALGVFAVATGRASVGLKSAPPAKSSAR